MRLAPAIEEFVRYKQALGNSYTTSARALKTFLRTCPETSERNHGRNMRRDLLPIA
jgi:hypothetical protein